MSDHEYILKKSLTENDAFFSFKGDFQRMAVTWHVHLCTCRSQVFDTSGNNKQFIEIDPSQDPDHYQVCVCLNIARITAADITKTIIMLSQYKHLSVGRHEYGEPF